MSSVKWYMFNVHFWSALLDLSFSFLTSPYILFPYVAGYGSGFLMWLGVNPLVQTTIIITEIGMTVLSILVLFENRFTTLVPTTKSWYRFRKIFIVFLYIFALTYFIPFNFLLPEQTVAVQVILQKIPSLRCFYSGPIVVYALDATLVGWVTTGKLLVEFLFILILCGLTYSNIKHQNKNINLSQKTLDLQNRFFFCITVQTIIPFAIIVLPLLCCAYSVVFQHFNQAMNNVCFLIISNHGLVTTFAIMFIHKPYRDATFPCEWVQRKRNKTDIISVIMPTIE